MAKSIILCSDGTGNAFDERSTNVSQLIRSIDVCKSPAAHERPQIAFYDQGVGTNPALVADAKAYSRSRAVAETLTVLPVPKVQWWAHGLIGRLAGLTVGYGLKENVRELVRALAEHHTAGDNVYLFGFSRGAFTIRAVAGFVHRCGLPLRDESFDEWFEQGFDLYKVHFPPTEDIKAFQRRSRLNHAPSTGEAAIHFLGIWDTVKSYGGIKPISWPHLRHNPSVAVVRHALALDEQRAWFHHTTWGSSKEKLYGVPLEPDDRYETQNVQEVWFRGYHSDVGGGKEERESARVSLLWMLGEAVDKGLRLNDDGRKLFENKADFDRQIVTHNSFSWWWPVVGLVPRQDLHNDFRPPRRTWVLGARSRRDPLLPELKDSHQTKTVLVHVSAYDALRLPSSQKVKAYTQEPPSANVHGPRNEGTAVAQQDRVQLPSL